MGSETNYSKDLMSLNYYSLFVCGNIFLNGLQETVCFPIQDIAKHDSGNEEDPAGVVVD